MTTAVRAAFAVLVIATFGAFFVAQRLKNSPPVLSHFGRTPVVSPNGDGNGAERADVSFRLRDSDRITVTVVDTDGDEVRELVSGRDAPADKLQRFTWDGRDGDGRRARDGTYRYRVILQRQGRSVVMQRSTRVDTVPPHPRIVSTGPDRDPGPELLPKPDGTAAEVHVQASGSHPRILLFDMTPGAIDRVGTYELDDDELEDGQTTWAWDGRLQDGRRAPSATYLAVIEVRDKAGNVGRSVRLYGRAGFPRAAYGAALPGRGGITVRYLGVKAPLSPAVPGEFVEFQVDSREVPYTWRVHRVGAGRVLARSGDAKTSGRLRFHAPGRDGVYLLEVRAGSHVKQVPFAVQDPARPPQDRVLVVLPTMTWQGRNPVDIDGDGLPNLLDRGLPVELDGMLAGDGLPFDFARRDALLLAWLDRTRRAYDVTTDVALLAADRGPKLSDYRGVLLPSDLRWLTRQTLLSLRAYVSRGGTVATFGADALRREVTVRRTAARSLRLVSPTPAATTDAFGARPRRPERLPAPVTLAVTKEDPQSQMFDGTNGQFPGYAVLQELATTRGLLEWATTDGAVDGGPVIAAQRVGDGLVLRYPLPELPAKLSPSDPDPQAEALLARAWTLLSR